MRAWIFCKYGTVLSRQVLHGCPKRARLSPETDAAADDQQFDIYWNGANVNSRRTGEGVYKAILTWKTDDRSGVLSAVVGVEE